MSLNIFKNYHPRFNSVEQWFSQIKHYMKLDKITNLKALKDSLKSSIKKIKEEYYKNYFIQAYNKDHYKNEEYIKISNKHRKPKNYSNIATELFVNGSDA